jgi:alpha-L-rhamnosidase
MNLPNMLRAKSLGTTGLQSDLQAAGSLRWRVAQELAERMLPKIAVLENGRTPKGTRLRVHTWAHGFVFILFLLVAATSFASLTPSFSSAKPVWPKGRETEKNLLVGFRATFRAQPQERLWLRATGSTIYRVFLNGQFLAHGPARGPHGYYRVDEWDLGGRLQPGENVVAFEVAGYNVNSYSLLDQPSFLQAEVVGADGKVLASTEGRGTPFTAKVLSQRVQKVQRYSFQRPFSEAYRLSPGDDAWRKDTSAKPSPVKLAVLPDRKLLARRVNYPDYTVRQPVWLVSRGELRTGIKADNPWKDRSLTAIGSKLGGYLEKDLETIPSLELQTITISTNQALNQPWTTDSLLSLKSNNWAILDLGCNLTGFIGTKVTCRSNARLFLTFDEIQLNGDVDFKRLGCVNIIEYRLKPGTYDLESLEPYTLRFLKLMVLEGDCEFRGTYLREFASSGVQQAQFAASDERLNRLFAAGRETFRQNAVDLFMDCPSRERAGWLCDSFFTSRVAKDLCGDTRIEQNFFENFMLPEKFACLPEGMLPMCYPADHNDGVFIPNWALWFVVELEEYLARSGDRATVDALKPRVLKLLDYFKRFKNDDGLLEKLENWVFVEWSAANSFTQDVNYPSNMLYARALEASGRMYDLPELVREAEKVRDTIRYQAFDGHFFIDNARRVAGKLQPTTNRTEVCQYFAFYFDVAKPETHSELWQRLLKDFGPQRKQTKAFPEVHPANAFIGNVLRLELLSRYGVCQQLVDESLAYQLYMVDWTGTLWENDGAYASCDHGFASHGGVHVLYRDVLGLQQVDTVNKTVQLRFTDSKLDWCEGRMPTPDGPVELRWRKEGAKRVYQATAPAGYAIQIDNRSPLPAERR